MSYVWHVILSFSDEEFWHDGEDEPRDTCDALDVLNQWMPHDKLVDLTPPTFDSSCINSPHLYGGGFSRFDIEGFIAAVEAQEWKEPENVQLFLKGESDTQFSLHSIRPPQSVPES